MKSLKNVLAGLAFVFAASTAFAFVSSAIVFVGGTPVVIENLDVPEDLTICDTEKTQMCIVTFAGQQLQAYTNEQFPQPLKRDF
ncbi:hypothetical protein FNH22_03760 [Fulvivirga sp. M361]|uniref:DUF6520 family protein n=1 Tax=Fulvivirga sp. M361 TaxID=2594266 RepID=UPI00117B8778|nr:DUF6520 family protein [Fulvivirga sp. M361]TRX61181.1 hypothetical protein FNH22_03760 [Fulvivirga sp. M361]